MGLFLGLLGEFIVAAEISKESYFPENEARASFIVDDGPVQSRSGWHDSTVNEVRRRAVAILEERLGLSRREYLGGYPRGGLHAFLIPNISGVARNGVSRVLGDINVPYAAVDFSR